MTPARFVLSSPLRRGELHFEKDIFQFSPPYGGGHRAWYGQYATDGACPCRVCRQCLVLTNPGDDFPVFGILKLILGALNQSKECPWVGRTPD